MRSGSVFAGPPVAILGPCQASNVCPPTCEPPIWASSRPSTPGASPEQLDEEDIVWWSKEPGYLSRIWEHGVRLFVDRTEVEHAREVARGVIGGEP